MKIYIVHNHYNVDKCAMKIKFITYLIAFCEAQEVDMTTYFKC